MPCLVSEKPDGKTVRNDKAVCHPELAKDPSFKADCHTVLLECLVWSAKSLMAKRFATTNPFLILERSEGSRLYLEKIDSSVRSE